MLVDKNEVMYYIDQALFVDPNNENLKNLKEKVSSINAAVLFLCNGEACETENQSCKQPKEDACTLTKRVEYAKNFEPFRDQNGRCICFIEKEDNNEDRR